jgi:hypothetical protein
MLLNDFKPTNIFFFFFPLVRKHWQEFHFTIITTVFPNHLLKVSSLHKNKYRLSINSTIPKLALSSLTSALQIDELVKNFKLIINNTTEFSFPKSKSETTPKTPQFLDGTKLVKRQLRILNESCQINMNVVRLSKSSSPSK